MDPPAEGVLADPEMQRLFAAAFAIAQIELQPGQNAYLCYPSRSSADFYCYTPHPDVHGNYHVWTYKAIGRGARKKKTAKRWRMIEHEVVTSRRSARSEALYRWQQS